MLCVHEPDVCPWNIPDAVQPSQQLLRNVCYSTWAIHVYIRLQLFVRCKHVQKRDDMPCVLICNVCHCILPNNVLCGVD